MNLIARLGLDGSGFQAGLARAVGHADQAGVKMSRSIASQFTKLGLAMIGTMSAQRFINEAQRWASDINSVKAEYEALGMSLDSSLIQNMVRLGLETARTEKEVKRLMVTLGTTIYSGVDKALKGYRVIFAGLSEGFGKNRSEYDTLGEAIAGGMMDEKAKILKESKKTDAEIKMLVDSAMYSTGKEFGPPLPPGWGKQHKSSMAVSSIETDQLGRIGGSVGLPNDRTYGVLREQLSQLLKIEGNTRESDSYVP